LLAEVDATDLTDTVGAQDRELVAAAFAREASTNVPTLGRAVAG
jgi:hypothetical protein